MKVFGSGNSVFSGNLKLKAVVSKIRHFLAFGGIKAMRTRNY
ncbi:hypothetical protein HMPREF6745_2110 [Prevotella sp. oral taxon 472 str. F0295]|nr:hypothetical protein HMPREF6745_2110 [Prevotella sp. oral taxon 472 str. F0295]